MKKNRILKDYWEVREETYHNLNLVSNKRMAYEIVKVLKQLSLNRLSILDVGCGGGVITKVVKENFRGSTALGIDISEKMVNKANQDLIYGLHYKCKDFLSGDLRNFLGVFSNPSPYNLIMMNLVLHHLVDGGDVEAIERAYKLVSPNGIFLISEAVPPYDELFSEYQRMFSLKERRNCYLTSHLVTMMRLVGFERVRSTSYRFKIRLLNWLNDETLPVWKKRKIYNLHVNASKGWKEAYNQISLPGGDFELTCKMVMVSGKKV